MIVCFDIGASRIKAALALGRMMMPLGEAATPTDDFAAFVAALAHFIKDHARAVSISLAGVIDAETGIATVANIPCLDGRSVANDLFEALGLPVQVQNDADCFALAEARFGAGRGHRRVFGLILGSGVGGGIVIDGKVLEGAGGFAGEWGHGPVIRDPAFACGCGHVGCLDTIGSARGLERLHRHLTGQEASSHQILDRWRAGEAATVALWLDLLSGPLAMLVNTLGADVVPVGGGLGNAPDLIAALDRAVRVKILRKTAAPLVVPAEVSADAGLAGAAAAGEAFFGEGSA